MSSSSIVASTLVALTQQGLADKKEKKLYEIGEYPKTVEEMRKAVDAHFHEVLARMIKENQEKEEAKKNGVHSIP